MIIVKIGGGAGINIKGVIEDLAELNKKNEQFIIVHGANAARDELARDLGIEKKKQLHLCPATQVFFQMKN
ncbi:MAG: hypothetical protein ABIG89_03015 [Candidatus Woesearchaeota archaeon]